MAHEEVSDDNGDLDDYIYDFEVSIDGVCYRVRMPHSEMVMLKQGGEAYNDTSTSEAGPVGRMAPDQAAIAVAEDIA